LVRTTFYWLWAVHREDWGRSFLQFYSLLGVLFRQVYGLLGVLFRQVYGLLGVLFRQVYGSSKQNER
jgi:hypothetical protein